MAMTLLQWRVVLVDDDQLCTDGQLSTYWIIVRVGDDAPLAIVPRSAVLERAEATTQEVVRQMFEGAPDGGPNGYPGEQAAVLPLPAQRVRQTPAPAEEDPPPPAPLQLRWRAGA